MPGLGGCELRLGLLDDLARSFDVLAAGLEARDLDLAPDFDKLGPVAILIEYCELAAAPLTWTVPVWDVSSSVNGSVAIQAPEPSLAKWFEPSRPGTSRPAPVKLANSCWTLTLSMPTGLKRALKRSLIVWPWKAVRS